MAPWDAMRGAKKPAPPSTSLGRAGYLLLGGFLVLAGYGVATLWVTVGDSTCGAPYRPDLWVSVNGCANRVWPRAVLAAALILAGLVIAAWSAWPRRGRPVG